MSHMALVLACGQLSNPVGVVSVVSLVFVCLRPSSVVCIACRDISHIVIGALSALESWLSCLSCLSQSHKQYERARCLLG